MKLSELTSPDQAQAAEPQADEPQALPPVAELFAQGLRRVDEACAAAGADLRAVPERALVYARTLEALRGPHVPELT